MADVFPEFFLCTNIWMSAALQPVKMFQQFGKEILLHQAIEFFLVVAKPEGKDVTLLLFLLASGGAWTHPVSLM